jgi:hypothetical protein
MPDHRATIESLRQNIAASPGMAFIQRMHARSFSLNVFAMSVRELRASLAAVQNPDVGINLMDVKNEEVGRQAEREMGEAPS